MIALVADGSRRLWRHGLVGAAHRRRRRWLFVAIFGAEWHRVLGFNWPWEIYVPVAMLIAGIVSALIGAIAVRTAGIYTIMITLATAAAFFYFAQQNYWLFNGHSGFRGVATPEVAFGVAWRSAGSFLLPLSCWSPRCCTAPSFMRRVRLSGWR